MIRAPDASGIWDVWHKWTYCTNRSEQLRPFRRAAAVSYDNVKHLPAQDTPEATCLPNRSLYGQGPASPARSGRAALARRSLRSRGRRCKRFGGGESPGFTQPVPSASAFLKLLLIEVVRIVCVDDVVGGVDQIRQVQREAIKRDPLLLASEYGLDADSMRLATGHPAWELASEFGHELIHGPPWYCEGLPHVLHIVLFRVDLGACPFPIEKFPRHQEVEPNSQQNPWRCAGVVDGKWKPKGRSILPDMCSPSRRRPRDYGSLSDVEPPEGTDREHERE